jgi:arsenite/tail-anchored protein-transporting ATPase
VLLSRERPLTFFGGKGGVGKTTLAAATALATARAGRRTLLVSTDPAHSLGDVLGVALADRPVVIEDRLSAVEIDAAGAAAAHVAAVESRMAAALDPELMPAVRRHLDLARAAPGTLEAALFDVVAGLMEACPGEHERIVFDTAPTGHTLRLLALPALLSAWVEGLVRQRETVAGMERMLHNMAGREDRTPDPVLAALHERRARFERAARRLRDDAGFWLVLVPERLPIEETGRAAATLAAQGLHVAGLVVNRRLPADADGAFLAARRAQQRVYEHELETRFRGHRLVRVAQRPHDVVGRADLAAIAAALPAALVTGAG